MGDVTIPRSKELLELSKADLIRVFREDDRALGELAEVVHAKALNGDNAAGHLDVEIRKRRAAMWGYDSPRQYDMTLVAEIQQPTSTQVLKQALHCVIETMSPQRQAAFEKLQRYGVEEVARSLPDCTSECTSDSNDDQKVR